MKKIILVAETGSDITPELAEKYGIQMVPMHVRIVFFLWKYERIPIFELAIV